jgi:hypothetical protein
MGGANAVDQLHQDQRLHEQLLAQLGMRQQPTPLELAE